MPSVLVVDDEPYVTRLLKLRLEKHGYQIETATDGDEALEKLETGSFDAVVTDYNMPGLNGRQLCESLRGRAGGQGMPIFLVTARIDPELESWVKSDPLCEFVEKPLSVRRLLTRLEAVLRAAGSAGRREG